MATAIQVVLQCHQPQTAGGSGCTAVPFRRAFFPRFSKTSTRYPRLVCNAASAAGGAQFGGDDNPYEVLGVNPVEGFDTMRKTYARRCKDAERRGDEAALAKLEKAYDKIMMSQLSNRKKGLTFGSFQVSKDIKFADKQPIVPWGPRFSRSSLKDMRINMAISAAFIGLIAIKKLAEWVPMQFLSVVFTYRIFEKLKSSEPDVSPFNEEFEEEGRGLRMGKRILRSLGLVFGCIAVVSLSYTGILNVIEFIGQAIPSFLYNNQELFVSTSTSVALFFLASYYR
ncbi:Chloroplast J-like domain 1-containing protein [Zostera marina]|uniref:Chloroplast J-like domain 1-containing protein n=1 Tax=Zostera marina TaxID=29655 RepID=A0A0K9PA75_ZOSMR|nr:Chloroplast J-like domain 1-containing protein [Zostera marina]